MGRHRPRGLDTAAKEQQKSVRLRPEPQAQKDARPDLLRVAVSPGTYMPPPSLNQHWQQAPPSLPLSPNALRPPPLLSIEEDWHAEQRYQRPKQLPGAPQLRHLLAPPSEQWLAEQEYQRRVCVEEETARLRHQSAVAFAQHRALEQDRQGRAMAVLELQRALTLGVQHKAVLLEASLYTAQKEMRQRVEQLQAEQAVAQRARAAAAEAAERQRQAEQEAEQEAQEARRRAQTAARLAQSEADVQARAQAIEREAAALAPGAWEARKAAMYALQAEALRARREAEVEHAADVARLHRERALQELEEREGAQRAQVEAAARAAREQAEAQQRLSGWAAVKRNAERSELEARVAASRAALTFRKEQPKGGEDDEEEEEVEEGGGVRLGCIVC
jgi:hypothetical protein